MRSHSISPEPAPRREKITREQAAREAIAQGPGLPAASDDLDQLTDRYYPMPLDTSDQDLVFVGRIRRRPDARQRRWRMWCCGDQIRKGAATNAVQIAQAYIG